MLRHACLALAMLAAGPSLALGDIKAPVPSADPGSYNPELTAREAVLVIWKLAISGIGAGKYVADQVVGASWAAFAPRAAQAEFATRTLLLRHASSYWLFKMDEGLTPVDGAVILEAWRASTVPCDGACTGVGDALTDAFATSAAAFEGVAQAAEHAAAARAEVSDTQALSELLGNMAAYPDSGAWARDLTLTEAGMDGKEVSARVVGTLAVWRNAEPFVGLRSAEIDAAVNAATDRLLRDVRRNTRGKAVLTP